MAKDKRINEEIRASRVKVITESGEQLGILSIDKALEVAEERQMDLVEIGEQDGVVLTKLMDYGKFLFKQQKNISKAKTNSKKTDIKTTKISYKIGDHDLSIKRTQAIKFANEGHPLKIMLRLKGRENQYAVQAAQKMTDFANSLEEVYKMDGKIVKAGNTFTAMLHPKK